MTDGEGKNGASRAGLWLSIATSAFVLLAGIGAVFYIGFKVQATADVQEVRGKRIAAIEERQAATDNRLTKIETAEVEIETQFCGVSRDINRMHANDLRVLALLWHKSFGDDYPISNSYYPEYGRCGKSKSP